MKSIGMLALEKKLEQPRFVKALGSRSYQITRYTRPAAVLLPVPESINPKLIKVNYRMFGSLFRINPNSNTQLPK